MNTLGSRKSTLTLSYKNFDIFCCHLDGYQSDAKALLNRLSEVEPALMAGKGRLRVWFNLDESRLDADSMRRIARSLANARGKIIKIAFIGLGGITKLRFRRILKKALSGCVFPAAYFSDAEKAKGWLIAGLPRASCISADIWRRAKPGL